MERLVCEESGDWRSDWNEANLRFNLPAVGCLMKASEGFFNFCAAIAVIAQP